MIGLIQRVSQASVMVDVCTVGSIERGFLLYLGIEQGDTSTHAEKLVHKVLNLRVFEDKAGKMNDSLQQINGALLVVSQFTLAATTQTGHRPSFSAAAPPDQAARLFEYYIAQSRLSVQVETGQFGANMQVTSVNDGPATFYLKI